MSIQALILIGLFMIIIMTGVYALVQHRKLYGHYFNFWIVLFIILVPAIAQEEPGFAEPDPFGGIDEPIDPGPLVFPETMPHATHEISTVYYGMLGNNVSLLANITTFDQEWRAFLNETNLTA